MSSRRTRDEALDAAADVLVACDIACAAMTPREQAESAWTPTSPYTVDELEQRIRARREGRPIPEFDGKPAARPRREGGSRRHDGA